MPVNAVFNSILPLNQDALLLELRVIRKGLPYTECDHLAEQFKRYDKEISTRSINSNKNVFHISCISSICETALTKLVTSLANLWQYLTDNDVSVSAIRQTPRFEKDVPTCLPKSTSENSRAYGMTREEALKRYDPTLNAAIRVPKVKVLDLNDNLCSLDYCPPVIGNVVVYRDTHHLTTTFVKTMTPIIGEALDQALAVIPTAVP